MKQFYLFALLLLGISTFAQSYQFTYYNTNSGMPTNNVNDFKIGANGIMWITTNAGLVSMNGSTITTYNTMNSSIPDTVLNKVAVSPNNTVWISTYQNGVIRFMNNTWTHYRMDNSAIPNNVINGIATDSSNNLWVATPSGLAKFNGTTWTTYNESTNGFGFSNEVSSVFTDGTTVYYTAGYLLNKLVGTTFTAITDGAEKIIGISGGKIFMSTGDGLYVYASSNEQNVYWTNNSCLADCGLNVADVDQNNKIWLGLFAQCNSGGVQRFTDCVSYNYNNSQIPDTHITSLDVINSDLIWVGTQENGLVKMTLAAASNCNPPTNTAAGEITYNSAVLTWTAPTPAPTGYKYRYNTSPEMGGTEYYTTSTSAIIGELSPNSDYYWWVKSVCASGESDWVLGGSFATLVAPASNCFKTVVTSQAAHSFGIKQDGSLWAWGANGEGQLGDGTFTNRLTPKRIGTGTNWSKIATGEYHTLAIKTDGTLWAWGNNSDGELGNGNYTGFASPIQIGSSTQWVAVAAGSNFSLALKSDGTLWAWGNNQAGQLGIGNTTPKNVPTQVGVSTNWGVISAGNLHAAAIRTTGTLWTWGKNINGQLGQGTNTNSLSSPTQVGALSTWKTVSAGSEFTVATKTNNSLWTWGSNTYGQLGLGNTTDKNTPTQVGTFTTWDMVAAGKGHVVASRTYGAVFAWGYNFHGQIGNGNNTNVLTPGLLFNSDDFLSVAAGNQFSGAIDEDGNLYTWGFNDLGQLGNGTNTSDNEAYGSLPCPNSNLGIEDITVANEIKVYPNPAKDSFKIDYPGNITAIQVYDTKGALVKTITTDFTTDINISALPAGMYLLNIKNDSGNVVTKRLLKQ